jgi:hypothetical protein
MGTKERDQRRKFRHCSARHRNVQGQLRHPGRRLLIAPAQKISPTRDLLQAQKDHHKFTIHKLTHHSKNGAEPVQNGRKEPRIPLGAFAHPMGGPPCSGSPARRRPPRRCARRRPHPPPPPGPRLPALARLGRLAVPLGAGGSTSTHPTPH